MDSLQNYLQILHRLRQQFIGIIVRPDPDFPCDFSGLLENIIRLLVRQTGNLALFRDALDIMLRFFDNAFRFFLGRLQYFLFLLDDAAGFLNLVGQGAPQSVNQFKDFILTDNDFVGQRNTETAGYQVLNSLQNGQNFQTSSSPADNLTVFVVTEFFPQFCLHQVRD